MPLLNLPVEPDDALEVSVTPKIREARFGDGYSQRSPVGLNNTPESWRLLYERKPLDPTSSTYPSGTCETVYQFFKDRGGWEAFTWTPPGQTASKKFICKSFSRTLDYYTRNIQTVTALIEEVFDQ